MTINLDKSIYTKNAIYQSLEIWNQYLHTPKISENNTTINIIIDPKKVEENTIAEFLNYVLDLTTSEKLL